MHCPVTAKPAEENFRICLSARITAKSSSRHNRHTGTSNPLVQCQHASSVSPKHRLANTAHGKSHWQGEKWGKLFRKKQQPGNRPDARTLCPRKQRSQPHGLASLQGKPWWPGAESNHRHKDFQNVCRGYTQHIGDCNRILLRRNFRDGSNSQCTQQKSRHRTNTHFAQLS